MQKRKLRDRTGMDLPDPNRFSLHRKPTTSSERFLGVPSHSPLHENRTSSGSISGADELSEDDVVFLGGDYSEPNHSSTPTSSSNSTPRHHLHNPHSNHHSYKGFGPPDTCGILAALPGNEASVSGRNGLHFFHKSSASSASSSSPSPSRMILAIPKPPQDRISSLSSSSSSARYLHPQSAPVNVPILLQEMIKTRRRHHEFEDIGEDDDDEEMLPPHEIVARNSAQTCSVLEGAGRTLKGRDLRKVRNAVWQQTGFVD